MGAALALPTTAHSQAPFGLIGDGVADDTAALQAFFDQSHNRNAVLPEGRFRITAPIRLDPLANYRVVGQGAEPNAYNGTTIIHDGPGAAIEIIGKKPGTDNFIVFSDFAIRGTMKSGSGIVAKWVHGLKLERIWLTTLRGHGINLNSCWGCKLSNVVATHSGGDGLRIIERGNLISIRDSSFNDNGKIEGANVRLAGSAQNESLSVTLDGCDFSMAAEGLVMQHLWSARVVGCYSEACSRLVWADSTVRGLTFQSNYLQDGVAMFDGVEALDLSGNTFNRQTGRTELRLRRTQNTRVGPNYFTGGAGLTEVGHDLP